jgi:hypothetical protein
MGGRIGMKKRETFMLSSTVFSLGIVLGFLLSPIKKGIHVYGGSSKSNNYIIKYSTTDEDNNIH